MLKKLDKKNKVKSIDVDTNFEINRFQNKEVTLNNFNIKDIISDSFDVFFIHLEYLHFVFRTNESSILTNTDFKIIQKFDKNFVFYHDMILCNKNYKIISPRIDFNENGEILYNLKIYNFKSKKIESDLNNNLIGFKYLIENSIIVNCNKNKNQLQAYSLLTAELLWQFNLLELGTWLYDKKEERPYEVDKFIGVFNNILLVSCFSGVIIALELNTGKLLNQWSNYPVSYTMDRFTVTGINPSYCSQLDTPNNTLIGFNFFTLWKIDLQTTQLNVTNLKEEFAKHDLRTFKRTMGFVVTETHYIITAETTIKEHINRGLDCLLAINKQTHIIDWKHQFAENEALKRNDIPQYANEKIYQLDWDNTLHIFEKEER
ncbi:hypothetical protein [Maribacter sp. Asnod2-G09]|uniref:hypothetical protein n=1 Tax=Maribacter sp. Asnod2-G09 TaxID=3160577 RepID=UPI00386554CC